MDVDFPRRNPLNYPVIARPNVARFDWRGLGQQVAYQAARAAVNRLPSLASTVYESAMSGIRNLKRRRISVPGPPGSLDYSIGTRSYYAAAGGGGLGPPRRRGRNSVGGFRRRGGRNIAARTIPKRRKRVVSARMPKAYRRSILQMVRRGNVTINRHVRGYYTQLSSLLNQCSYTQIICLDKIDLAALTARIGSIFEQEYDTADAVTEAEAGTKTTIANFPHADDPAGHARLDVTGQKNTPVYIKKAVMTMTLRNNADSNARVMVWKYWIKRNTSHSWATDFDEGVQAELEDTGFTTATTDPHFYPKHGVSNWHDCYVLSKKPMMYTIAPGQEVHLVASAQNRYWNPDETVKFPSETYFKARTFGFIIRLVGTIGHDTTTKNLVGLMPTFLDCSINKTFYYGLLHGKMRSVLTQDFTASSATAVVQLNDQDTTLDGTRA